MSRRYDERKYDLLVKELNWEAENYTDWASVERLAKRVHDLKKKLDE